MLPAAGCPGAPEVSNIWTRRIPVIISFHLLPPSTFFQLMLLFTVKMRALAIYWIIDYNIDDDSNNDDHEELGASGSFRLMEHKDDILNNQWICSLTKTMRPLARKKQFLCCLLSFWPKPNKPTYGIINAMAVCLLNKAQFLWLYNGHSFFFPARYKHRFIQAEWKCVELVSFVGQLDFSKI